MTYDLLSTAILQRSLRRAGEFLGVDRAYLLLSQDGRRVHYSCEWSAPGIVHANAINNAPAQATPWWWSQLLTGNTISISDVAALDPKAEPAKQHLEANKIRAVCAVPVRTDGAILGCVGFDQVTGPHNWSAKELEFSRLTADLIAASLSAADEFAERTSHFLSRTNHAFRSPLTAILGYGQLMASDATMSEEHQDNVRQINAAGEQLLKLINETFDTPGTDSVLRQLAREAIQEHSDTPHGGTSIPVAGTHPQQHRSVLYVEDNPANMALVKRLLRRLPGVRLLSAATPERGIELALTCQPTLILLDINLPGMDGYQVLERLQADTRLEDTPIIAITANATPRDIKRGRAAGFVDYLTKPLDIEHFLTVVDGHLNEATP